MPAAGFVDSRRSSRGSFTRRAGRLRHHVDDRVEVEDQRDAAVAQDAGPRQPGDRAEVLLQRLEHDLLHADQLVDQQADRRLAVLDDDDRALLGRLVDGGPRPSPALVRRCARRVVLAAPAEDVAERDQRDRSSCGSRWSAGPAPGRSGRGGPRRSRRCGPAGSRRSRRRSAPAGWT